ncbi:4-(cytidine 5'-diphospho)-2-C-methyl-D-erythritol kinase [Nocardioides sp. Soil805]|uniref:4-(cytidine 5'-diphospho)-2-C-methyl-D-erythritol kinase n=1 Tax=Nocardioides sp. Soil805 TaxID=1736416 RepID=UPI00070313EF|nr:4-(cytidine 5'-diphospho)-2-C-methyl-D-erythritol kinase [Nocardioides sp. Soil805]KRF37016.1 4-diphosphocytidyl-2C-methyl-D-erythritol kinase [Nocardioides sp. Soil805]
MVTPERRLPRSVDVRASAKINLHLGVGAAREDGFHPLETVYQAIGLHDELVATEDEAFRVVTHGAAYVDVTDVPVGADNIVARATALMAARVEVEPTADFLVHKEIPVAGGMAGGSADAAAALLALDRLWDAGTPDDELLALAAELGSDVPFALIGGTALGTGRGELVTPIADSGPWWWVVVPSSAGGLSTPAVYRRFDEMFPGADPEPASAAAVISALATHDPHRLGAALHNDLQEPAIDLRPDLGDLLDRGESEGAVRGLVSGSGPTCLFLAESPTAAHALAGALRGSGQPVVLVAAGPVPGAQVVDAP